LEKRVQYFGHVEFEKKIHEKLRIKESGQKYKFSI